MDVWCTCSNTSLFLSLAFQKQDINDAPNIDIPFVPPCNLRHKDALSAVRRVKSESCRRTIIRTACLAESKRLHDIDIKRTCPVPRSKGSPAKWIDVSTKPYGPPIRIAYVLTVHGRAFRQVKRLFKAIYHIQHYFYFHVDSVSMFDYCTFVQCEGMREKSHPTHHFTVNNCM